MQIAKDGAYFVFEGRVFAILLRVFGKDQTAEASCQASQLSFIFLFQESYHLVLQSDAAFLVFRVVVKELVHNEDIEDS